MNKKSDDLQEVNIKQYKTIDQNELEKVSGANWDKRDIYQVDWNVCKSNCGDINCSCAIFWIPCRALVLDSEYVPKQKNPKEYVLRYKINESRCIGCSICTHACNYGAFRRKN
jgi:formate hydrogenlyase subunit 6/NADH:ubiquinone oxidoreductase subunit I